MHSCILPMPVLLLGIALVAARRGANLQDAILNANSGKGRWQWRHLYFRRLVDTLCVSRELIAVKLRRLRVFTEGTLTYHKSYRLDNCWLHTAGRPPSWHVFKRIEDSLL